MYEYYSEVKDKEIKWLWYPFIPYGKITLVQGDPGEGKSTFILNIAALLTKGEKLPDGTVLSHPINVIYQCPEDDVADTIKPRLIKAGADCSRIAYIIDETGELNIEDSRIEETIIETGARLLILDPLQSFLVNDTDMHSAGRMRAVLGKLALIAERHECAVVLIGHMNKGNGKNLYRGLGSIDIAAIARCVIMVSRDEDHPERRYAVVIKNNLAPEGGTIGFRFDNENRLRWTKENIEISNIGGYLPFNKSSQVKAHLIDILSEGPVYSAEIMDMFMMDGVSSRTVYSVKKELKIVSFKEEGKWYWKLPKN